MISGILMAAGQSTRMGVPKALLDWGEESLVRYQVRQLKEAGADEVIVVVGFGSDEIHRHLRGLGARVVLNPRYQLGRAGSLQVAAKAVDRAADAIIILNVDQPRPAELIRTVASRIEGEVAVAQPVSAERRGHPVVVAGSLREELIAASDDGEGLRGILEAHRDRARYVDADETCLLDINTPDDYEAAKAALTKRP
jgi:molybdenum cofactor cytidylyltransferase